MGCSCGGGKRHVDENEFKKVGLQIRHAYSLLNVVEYKNNRYCCLLTCVIACVYMFYLLIKKSSRNDMSFLFFFFFGMYSEHQMLLE